MARSAAFSMLYIRLAFGLVPLAAAGLWFVSGSAQTSQSFAIPADRVIASLAGSHRIVEGSGMGSLTVAGEGSGTPGLVRIGVMRAGAPHRVFCQVRVTAESDDSSRADLDCSQKGADEDVAKSIGGEALAIVVGEHVTASALHQPYDTDRVANAMLNLMARSAPALAANMQPPPEDHAPRRSSSPPMDDELSDSDEDTGFAHQ